MATLYRWHSPRKVSYITETLMAMTHWKKRIYPFSSSIDEVNADEANFKLWYRPLPLNRASYEPAMLKGKITNTPTGCTIIAEVKNTLAAISNFVCILVTILLYGLSIFMLFSGIRGNLIMFAMFFTVASIYICVFLITYNKYKNMKVHLEIMNAAAGVECSEDAICWSR